MIELPDDGCKSRDVELLTKVTRILISGSDDFKEDWESLRQLEELSQRRRSQLEELTPSGSK